MVEVAAKNSNDVDEAALKERRAKAPVRREIPGSLPYLPSAGTLKTVLERIVDAHRPDKFTADFLENVLNLKGGTPRASIGLLKKMGFLQGDGSPTELYAKFKTSGGRSNAAYLGLKNAYPEIFKKSEYAHNANEGKLNDLVVEITGLQKSDPIARQIKGTFNVIRGFILGEPGNEQVSESDQSESQPAFVSRPQPVDNESGNSNGIRLAYNINIVLPETSDLAVLDAIFRSLKENLLR